MSCESCPTPDNCEDCVSLNGGDVTVETVEVANPESFEAATASFEEAPAIIRLINTLGQSAQNIHDLGRELHPGDAGICVALAAQIGAVADMFVKAVNNAMEADNATQTEDSNA